jgi:hypothetical protein
MATGLAAAPPVLDPEPALVHLEHPAEDETYLGGAPTNEVAAP